MNWPTSDEQIIEDIVLVNEGSFTDNPVDPGGPTNFGVTLHTYSGFLGRPATTDELKAMTQAEAIEIYKIQYLYTPGFHQIADMRVRTTMVDTGVLFGPGRAIQFLQNAVGVVATEILGLQTLQAVNSFTDPRSICNSIAVQRIQYHVDHCVQDRSQIAFLRGWISRACRLIE